MLTWSTIVLFSLVALGLLLIPGPAVVYIVTHSALQGKQAGLASVLGIEVAGLVHAIAAALGLSAHTCGCISAQRAWIFSHISTRHEGRKR